MWPRGRRGKATNRADDQYAASTDVVVATHGDEFVFRASLNFLDLFLLVLVHLDLISVLPTSHTQTSLETIVRVYIASIN